jgi:arsenite methyltransferase
VKALSEQAKDTLDEALWAAVRERYGKAAEQVRGGGSALAAECCGGFGCCTPGAQAPFGETVYAIADLSDLPQAAVAASLGCGNPTALTELRPGDVVLDLGSGGGLDVILSARRVGPTGRAYGLDMTDEMLGLARDNARQAGVGNVEFLQGQIESVPLPDASVDVIISNCVVNLSPDKDRVLREAFRVLRPGGRLAISDVVVREAGPDDPEMPAAVRRSMELWAGCIAGALAESEYREKLAAAGFEEAEVQELRRYRAEEVGEPFVRALQGCGVTDPARVEAMAGRFMSTFVRARKPPGRAD